MAWLRAPWCGGSSQSYLREHFKNEVLLEINSYTPGQVQMDLTSKKLSLLQAGLCEAAVSGERDGAGR